nr:hypothetical protein [Halobellus sp. DFY28]
MVEVAVRIGKFSVIGKALELPPELANRCRGRVAFLGKSLLGKSEVALPTLFEGVIETRCGDAVRLPAVREDTHSVRSGELVGTAFETRGGINGTRESWDVVLREWWRRCELKILI